MDGKLYLADIAYQYRLYKSLAENAAAQLGEEELFARPGGVAVSVAVLMKHTARNLRSRWLDFLTTDGEKQDRNRENEFSDAWETRDTIAAHWDEGWAITFDELGKLTPADLDRNVTIRGESHRAWEALHRNVLHVSYHTGQIVQLARAIRGPEEWKSLSVAPGGSEDLNAKMREKYGDWWGPDFQPGAGE